MKNELPTGWREIKSLPGGSFFIFFYFTEIFFSEFS